MNLDNDEKKILNVIKYTPIIFIIIISIVITKAIIIENQKHFNIDIQTMKSNYIEEKKNRVKEEVERIYNRIKLEKEQSILSENELKENLLNRIKKFKYDKKGYIFVYKLDGTCLAHFKSEFIGINRLNVKDKNGRFVVKDVLDFAKKNKQGFMSYIAMMKPDSEVKSREKVSYIKLFDDWNWVIGTGFYLDSLDEKIEKEKEKLIKYNDESINNLMFISFIVTLLTLLISLYISKYLKNNILIYKRKLEKQIDENVKQKEALLKAQKVAHIGDWKLDINTNKAIWSNEIIRILGLTQKEENDFGPEFLKSLMINEDIVLFENSIKKCIEKGEEHHCIYRIKRPNNEIRWIDCRGKLDDDKSFIIGTIQDITENKILEIEKQQKEELLFQQSKMAAMGEMLGNIAHQWRQPLSVISTAATGSKLQKEMGTLSDEEFNLTMDKVNNSAQYLSKTIDDFRDFFNPSNNKTKEFYISEMISKTLHLVSAQFTAKDIEIIKNIEDYKLLSIENEMIQVLINILNNARDAVLIKENQRKLIFINTYKKDNILYIEVLDNAGGIDKSIMERIFEPYFTTKHQSVGTGIGLYMSQEIIHKHLHGTIHASNEIYSYEAIEYTGAKFKIEIIPERLENI